MSNLTINGDLAVADGAMDCGSFGSSAKAALLDLIYPIDSLFLSFDETSPASFLGGTWEQLDSGKTLWTTTASGTGGNTYASKLPDIQGAFSSRSCLTTSEVTAGAFSFTENSTDTPAGTGSSKTTVYNAIFKASNYNSIYGTSTVVRPPCYRTYMWRRTA